MSNLRRALAEARRRKERREELGGCCLKNIYEFHDKIANKNSLSSSSAISASLRLREKFMVIIILFFILVFPIYGENEISLRIAPAIDVPLSIAEFYTGFGVDVSLDWGFWQFADNKFNLGVNAGGSFASLPFYTGDPINMMAGSAGVFLRYRPFDRFAFRIAANGGVYEYTRGSTSDVKALFGGSLGAEFFLSPYISLFADGKYTFRVFSGSSWNDVPLNSFSASLGIRLNLTEIMSGRSRVHVEKTEQYRVFPVSWAWYENNPVAAITVTNNEPNAITDISLSFFMDSYMSQPFTFANIPSLAAGDSIQVPVTALFNTAMMNLTETINANGLIGLQYRSLGARKETSAAIQMPIFHRNTLSWDDDRRAAAFVSPNDFAARYFARYVQTAIANQRFNNTTMNNVPRNVVLAAALFEALRLYGITYVVVPATSFANVSADESVLDNVSFPYQALFYRGGDCSYLSILFCSLLEALDVETAFITVPGHIYIAFDVGDNRWLAGNADIIEINGKRWMPLELTVPSEGFTSGWRSGARQWRANQLTISNEQLTEGASGSQEGAMLYPIREAWEIYPSVTVPASGDHLPEMPEWDVIIRAVTNELRVMGR